MVVLLDDLTRRPCMGSILLHASFRTHPKNKSESKLNFDESNRKKLKQQNQEENNTWDTNVVSHRDQACSILELIVAITVKIVTNIGS